MNISFVEPGARAATDLAKEKNGFAPNYIHSLDASHLLMTAVACKVRQTLSFFTLLFLPVAIGLNPPLIVALFNLLVPLPQKEDVTFATVHDSFWTHAATTPELNRLLREEASLLLDITPQFPSSAVADTFSNLISPVRLPASRKPLRGPARTSRSSPLYPQLSYVFKCAPEILES
jgi:hypothetical protein